VCCASMANFAAPGCSDSYNRLVMSYVKVTPLFQTFEN
jgi:hypothetical protein